MSDLKDFIIEDGVLVKYNGKEENVTVPKGVTSIGKEAFGRCENIKSIVLPDTVTSIDEWAFNYCIHLVSITIPDSVTSVEDSAFWECNRLKRTVFDNAEYIGNPENPHLILIEAKNENITACTVHENTKIIYGGAFLKCYKMESVTISPAVIEIGEAVFMWCENLKSITIPASVRFIGANAFCGCEKLKSIAIPASVEKIGTGVIRECKALDSITVDSQNKTYHSSGNCIIHTASKTVVAGCNKSVIPSDGSVTTIGKEAFIACDGITDVTLPETITSIEDEAFQFCHSLKSVTIPASVTSIGQDVFWVCDSLEHITVKEGNKVYHSAGNCLIETATKTLIAVRSHSVIPLDGSVTTIGDSAFGGDGKLTDFTVPSVITSIGKSAFGCCYKLESVTIPLSVTSIGEDAFEECDKLYDIFYEGSAENWHAIDIHEDWLYDTFDVTVHCSDEEIDY